MQLFFTKTLVHRAFGSTLIVATLLALLGAVGNASAAVILDPVVTTGVDAIDPAGDEAVDTELGDSQATLEAIAGFTAVHNWTDGTNSMDGGNDNTIAFTDSALPDIFFDFISHTGNPQQSGNTFEFDTNSARNASPSNNALINLDTNNVFTFAIDFGSYDADTDTFDPSVNSAVAAGFVFSNVKDGFSGTVKFRDDADNVLSTLDITPDTTVAENQEIFFGYDASGGTPIGSVLVEVTTSDKNAFVGLDDVGFATTIIPEPAGAVLVGLGGVILLSRRRRRGMPQSV